MALQDLADDELRRRRGSGMSGGMAGPPLSPGMMMPFLTGARQVYDFSQNVPGGAALRPGMGQGGPMGPAQRHAMRVGVDFPGFSNQNPVGGPNIAPGADNMQALQQSLPPGGGPPPWAGGLQNAMAQGGPPGQQLQQLAGGGGRAPQGTSDKWWNFAPGSIGAATLGYGTPAFGRQFGVGGAAAGQRPGEMPAPGQLAGGGPAQRGFGAGGPGGPGTTRPTPSGGTDQRFAPGGGIGGLLGQAGGGPGSGGGGGGQGGQGGGGQGGQSSGGFGGGMQQGGGGFTGAGGKPAPGPIGMQDNAGGVKGGKPKVNKPFDVIKGGGNPFVDSINIVPNQGNNNTPSEVNAGQPNKPPKPKPKSSKPPRRNFSNQQK